MKIETAFNLHETVYFTSNGHPDDISVYKGRIAEITVYERPNKELAFRYSVSKLEVYCSEAWRPIKCSRMSVNRVFVSMAEVQSAIKELKSSMIRKQLLEEIKDKKTRISILTNELLEKKP